MARPMVVCTGCRSFVPALLASCPECGASTPNPSPSNGARVLRGALALAGGSLFAVTLSACYGGGARRFYTDAGPRGDGSTTPSWCDDPTLDTDRDGYCGEHDCNEADWTSHEGAYDESGDGIDADCGGTDDMDEAP